MKLITTISLLLMLGIHAMPSEPINNNNETNTKTWEAWNPNTLEKANTTKKVKYLNAKEKDIIFYLNLARMDGKLFANTFLKDYEEKEGLKNSADYRSLIEVLNNQGKMLPISPQEDLSIEASSHAKEMGKSGKLGHTSLEGELFNVRTERLSQKYTKLRECNEYGGTDALAIVIYLLIDEDSKSKRRRKLLLDSSLVYAGAGSSFHVKYKTSTCILLAGETIKENQRLSLVTE